MLVTQARIRVYGVHVIPLPRTCSSPFCFWFFDTRLSEKFPSLKPISWKPIAIKASFSSPTKPNTHLLNLASSSKAQSKWCVYLIISSDLSKTYVGVTVNFDKRLKQHNGELRGGAKASRAGRPWARVCTIEGFIDRSEACQFESKWKTISRKLPRKRNHANEGEQSDLHFIPVVKHRETALDRVRKSVDCSHLNIYWNLDTP
ncbi:hypothetical protein AMTRI_Chr01g104840 [Amborella trichopoda]|uniref:GIY-YIG domain-containing protein n=1 Tax=Amborella trichopoda TaxID=13333 RepID=U5CWJ1_AMBTC|nr:uncharacterized protein LOC18442807 [Amborella trichopoda]ERN14504.1 hypothetical protein AMTR_s00038p00020170 [Amborella trichopoda]|eukprot:XP_006853037.1 uncharacterized protein LOC18442807 [Amborella trichopoda]